MKIQLLFTTFLMLVLGSCSPTPKDIKYGYDACHYCSMTIVDTQHASQLVTKTGKVFSFDSIECLVHHLQENEGLQKEGLVLVNTYHNPTELFDATKTTFLISENIPSPMGAFLTAFRSEEEAKQSLQTHGGDLYSWNHLLTSLY